MGERKRGKRKKRGRGEKREKRKRGERILISVWLESIFNRQVRAELLSMLNWLSKSFSQSLNPLSLLIRSSLSIYSKWLTRLNTVSILHTPMGLTQANAWDVCQNVYKRIKFRNVLQTLLTWFYFKWQQSTFFWSCYHISI